MKRLLIRSRTDPLTSVVPESTLTQDIAFATAQAERHPRLTYVGQDDHDLRLPLWGVPFPHVHELPAVNRATPEGFDRCTAFLERNGLEPMWRPGQTTAEFDARLEAAPFPPAVRPLIAADGTEIATRLQWLRDGMVLDITRHKQAYEHPMPHPPCARASSRHTRIQVETSATLSSQLAELREELRRSENTTLVGLLKRVGRVIGRALGRTP